MNGGQFSTTRSGEPVDSTGTSDVWKKPGGVGPDGHHFIGRTCRTEARLGHCVGHASTRCVAAPEAIDAEIERCAIRRVECASRRRSAPGRSNASQLRIHAAPAFKSCDERTHDIDGQGGHRSREYRAMLRHERRRCSRPFRRRCRWRDHDHRRRRLHPDVGGSRYPRRTEHECAGLEFSVPINSGSSDRSAWLPRRAPSPTLKVAPTSSPSAARKQCGGRSSSCG